MDIKATNAVNAYADALKRVISTPEESGDTSKLGIPSSPASGTSFADMVTDALDGALSVQKAGESAAMGAVTGKTELIDVVTAVTNAEVTLRSVVAVRDRVIAAYQEIIRMPI